MSKFIQDRKFPRIWVRKKNEAEGVNSMFRLKRVEDLDGLHNEEYRFSYSHNCGDAYLDLWRNKDDVGSLSVIQISICQTSKKEIAEILKVFGFDIEFITPLTDKEKLNEIHTLVGKTRSIDDTYGVLKQVYDLTKD